MRGNQIMTVSRTGERFDIRSRCAARGTATTKEGLMQIIDSQVYTFSKDNEPCATAAPVMSDSTATILTTSPVDMPSIR